MPEPAPKRLFHVSAWPIAVKLSLLLLLVSLLPMGVTAALDLWQARQVAEQAERDNLKRLAESGASRIDQLLADTQGIVAQAAADVEVVAYLGGDREAARASAQAMLANLVRSHEDVVMSYLLDARGTAVLSTDPADIGRDYSRRTYYQEAVRDGHHVSEILVGVTSRRPGVYFSHVVRDAGGALVGVAVVKLGGEVVSRMVGAIPPRGGGAFLVDSYGVVVCAADPASLFHSLATIPPDGVAVPAFGLRFDAAGVARIESLGLDALAREVLAASTGSSKYALRGGPRQIAGFASVSAKRWALAVAEPEGKLDAPSPASRSAPRPTPSSSASG